MNLIEQLEVMEKEELVVSRVFDHGQGNFATIELKKEVEEK